MRSTMLVKFIIFMAVISLISCTTVSNSHPQENQRVEVQQLANPYTMPAEAYLALAKNQSGLEQQQLQMMAAGRLIQDGQWQQGQEILTRMKDLSAELANEKKLLLAKIDLIREQPKAAINQLAGISEVNVMSRYHQAQFHDLLAQAYQASGKAAESVTERIKLEKVLPDGALRVNNLRNLWLALTALPVSELSAMAVETAQSEQKGWVELALISRKNYDDPQMLIEDIEHWQLAYPQHPAHTVLPLSHLNERVLAPPRKIAILVPVSGPLAGPGNAIRDGFMAAKKKEGSEVQIKTYDTQGMNVAELYQRAVDEGADCIVGPLTKTDVAIVASLHHPVPTLLLNDLNHQAQENAYQFGLSPSHEAVQVAAKARKSGHTRALVIAPAGAWGEEVVTAFTKQLQNEGGQVVDKLFYGPKDDLNAGIRALLQIPESEVRRNALQKIMGRNLEFTPNRRQDFDMVFLLAYPTKARQIMPLLKYYYVEDVPVYATSTAYSGNPNVLKDRDLNGLVFCDIPWIFTHQKAGKNWPEQFNSYNRLYALGMDSYTLATQLNHLLLFPAVGINEKSGILYLGPHQQISRVLAWGQFKQGKAQLLAEKTLA